MECEKDAGIPITSLREIDTLLNANHQNIVLVKVSRGVWDLVELEGRD